jgi:hypothetical protein
VEGGLVLKKIILTVGTVTQAIKAKKLLTSIGISAELIKVDASLSEMGCNFGIKIPYNRFYDSVGELKERKIHYAVYNTPTPRDSYDLS